MPEVMSTSDLPARLQFEAWASWMAGVFDVELPTPEHKAGFHAQNRFWVAGDVRIALAEAPSLGITRSPELIRRNPIDHWIVSLARKDVRISTGGTNHLVRGQSLFLSSMAHSFSSARPADQRMHIYLPRDRFPKLAALDSRRGMVLDTPLGGLFANFLRGLAACLPRLSEVELAHAGSALRGMANACITPDADHLAEAAQPLGAARLELIQGVIRRHLTSPELDVGLLCRAAGLSRTHLYRLLENEGGVLRYIQRQRLLACHGRLADMAEGRPIHAIAAEHGFDDPSRFSRIFRREFGLSPSDVRATARDGIPDSRPRQAPAGKLARTLQDHLRRL